MFSALSKVVDFVLGTLLEHDADPQKDNSSGVETYQNLGRVSASDTNVQDQDHPDILLTTLLDEREKNSESHTAIFTGKVTQLFCGHGLIDGEVYFSADSVFRGNVLRVGDQVNVVARQQHRDGGWVAETVTLLQSSWEEEPDTLVASTCEVGKVTQFRDEEGLINKNIIFDISNCSEGYRPHPGDWVNVVLEKEQEKENNEETEDTGFEDLPAENQFFAAKVSPLREWAFEGVVSAAMSDHGYIDEEVYFRLDACMNRYRPRKWDQVKVAAIESTQGKCSWRAVAVFPLSTDSAAYRSKQNRFQSVGRGRGWMVPGQRPQMFQRKHKMSIPNKLPQYPVPEGLRQCVMDQEELTTYSVHLTQMLSMESYIQQMSVLLHLEEIQMELDIREFDLHRVCLHQAGEFLALRVPGLAEGRPSVLIGDAVILSSPSDPDEPQYEGIVHELHSEEVLLKFNTEFHSRYNGEDYNVEFTFSRTSLRRCHQAAHLAVSHLGEEVLFPKDVNLKAPQIDLIPGANSWETNSSRLQSPSCPGSLSSQAGQESNQFSSITDGAPQHSASDCSDHGRKLGTDAQRRSEVPVSASPVHYLPNISHGVQDAVTFFNPHLNDRQKAAVIQILLGQARPVPYVIFGPPGTGKTVTVVEAILQIFSHVPKSRIVACTPSNSAADLLAERLHLSGAVKTANMVRLNAFQRSEDGIPDSILPYCCVGENLETVCRYRIIIATCNTAGLLYTAGRNAGHFTHAFIDEAGQATEPECLIPAGLVAGADGQIVLAGDPKQLGPVLMSPFAKMYGLELSFLERLMDRLPYQHNSQLYSEHGGFHSALVTMLVNNYRCHPAILSLPSQLFYYGQLQECAPKAMTHTLVNWHMLPTPGRPVVFHGIRGTDVREGDSPSWFNPGETVEVVHYLQGLLGNNPPIAPDDIGIITPYRKQVEKIRMMIGRLAIPQVKVGSVEEFQGQERQAIIISTVRSNEQLVRSDIRHVLGFLSNPKRFNVSITRAQALLVVIGNPHVLSQDEYWCSFIKMCVEKGCYRGCEVPDTLKPGNENSNSVASSENAATT